MSPKTHSRHSSYSILQITPSPKTFSGLPQDWNKIQTHYHSLSCIGAEPPSHLIPVCPCSVSNHSDPNSPSVFHIQGHLSPMFSSNIYERWVVLYQHVGHTATSTRPSPAFRKFSFWWTERDYRQIYTRLGLDRCWEEKMEETCLRYAIRALDATFEQTPEWTKEMYPSSATCFLQITLDKQQLITYCYIILSFFLFIVCLCKRRWQRSFLTCSPLRFQCA